MPRPQPGCLPATPRLCAWFFVEREVNTQPPAWCHCMCPGHGRVGAGSERSELVPGGVRHRVGGQVQGGLCSGRGSPGPLPSHLRSLALAWPQDLLMGGPALRPGPALGSIPRRGALGLKRDAVPPVPRCALGQGPSRLARGVQENEPRSDPPSCSGLSHPERPSRAPVSPWPPPSLSHVGMGCRALPSRLPSDSPTALWATSPAQSQTPGHNPAFSELGSER